MIALALSGAAQAQYNYGWQGERSPCLRPPLAAATGPAHYVVSAQHPGAGEFSSIIRNGRSTTAVDTYSPRARVGFPIAAPVTWK